MNAIQLQSTIQHAEGFIAAPVEKELMMLSIEKGLYYALDDIGRVIWEGTEAPIQVNSLVDQILKKFDVSREQCEADVLEFLNKLHANGMICVIDRQP